MPIENLLLDVGNEVNINAIEVADLINTRQLHKFGGSSLVDVNCYLRVATIMAEYSQLDDIIVVSAAGNTTNQLIDWIKFVQVGDRLSANQIQQAIHYYHSELISGLLPQEMAGPLINEFTHDLESLQVLLCNNFTDASYAEVVGYGEIWSARLMAAVLNKQNMQSVWLDARNFLCAERAAQPQIDKRRSYPLLKKLLIQYTGYRLIVTGFIARNYAGETVLLGRNGSDYSATQIAVLAGVMRVTIWSNVAGVYSADPRKVKDACLLPLLRLDEASELARLAAPVLHTRTLQPVSSSNIELQLRSSYQPKEGSTRIDRMLLPTIGVKMITSHDEICLIELSIASQYDFMLAQQDLHCILQRSQIKPLALNLYRDRNLVQLCYTNEVANSVLGILQDQAIPGKLELRKGLALVAMVGVDVTKNILHRYRFYQQLQNQPVEFFWHAEDCISLVAVLRQRPTRIFMQKLHKSLFCTEQRIGLACFRKGNIYHIRKKY